MKRLKKLIPLMCSFSNLSCGFGVVVCVFYGRYELAPWLILLAAIFDGYDGRLARYFNEASRLGGELDSLCDLIAFGIAPAMLVGGLLHKDLPILGWLLGFLFVVAAAYRLARFNAMAAEGIDSKQYYTGLPTTGAGGTIAAATILLFHYDSKFVVEALALLALILSILMVTKVKFPNSLRVVADNLNTPFNAFLVITAVIIFAMIPCIFPAVLFAGYIIVAFIGVLRERLLLKAHKL